MNSVWKRPMAKRVSPLEILQQAEKLLSRKEIAAGLNVSETVVKSWFEGKGTFSNTHLLRLADLLVKYAADNG